MSAFVTADFPYHTLQENSRPPTPDPCHYPLRLDNQLINHPRQDLRYHILPVNRMFKSLQTSIITRNRELTTLNQTSNEKKFEVTVKFIGLSPHPIPTSTKFRNLVFLL